MPSRFLDLTSKFTELTFRGSVEIVDSGDCCAYHFKDFEIEFVAMPNEFATKKIQLTYFSVGGGRTVNEFSPLAVNFINTGDIHRVTDLTFNLAKTALSEVKYLKFAVRGIRTLAWTRLYGGDIKVDRCVWPITARGNIIEERYDIFGVEQKHREPADPHDCCAPEKVW